MALFQHLEVAQESQSLALQSGFVSSQLTYAVALQSHFHQIVLAIIGFTQNVRPGYRKH